MSQMTPGLSQPVTWQRLYFMIHLHAPAPKTHDRLTSIQRETTQLSSWNTGTAINWKQHHCETGHLQRKIFSSQKQAKVAVLRNSSKCFWSGTKWIYNYSAHIKCHEIFCLSGMLNSGTEIAKMHRMLRPTTSSELLFSYKCTYNKTAELLEIKCCGQSRLFSHWKFQIKKAAKWS